MSDFLGHIFDQDGTAYLRDHGIPGAPEAVAFLRRRVSGVVLHSNEPLKSREVYAEKLTRLGISTTPDDVINSTLVLAQSLVRECIGAWCGRSGQSTLQVIDHPDIEPFQAGGMLAARIPPDYLLMHPMGLDYIGEHKGGATEEYRSQARLQGVTPANLLPGWPGSGHLVIVPPTME